MITWRFPRTLERLRYLLASAGKGFGTETYRVRILVQRRDGGPLSEDERAELRARLAGYEADGITDALPADAPRPGPPRLVSSRADRDVNPDECPGCGWAHTGVQSETCKLGRLCRAGDPALGADEALKAWGSLQMPAFPVPSNLTVEHNVQELEILGARVLLTRGLLPARFAGEEQPDVRDVAVVRLPARIPTIAEARGLLHGAGVIFGDLHWNRIKATVEAMQPHAIVAIGEVIDDGHTVQACIIDEALKK